MVCPCCRQGEVNELLIKPTGETIFCCEECEACWKARDEISNSRGFQLGPWLKSKFPGETAAHRNIEIIGSAKS